MHIAILALIGLMNVAPEFQAAIDDANHCDFALALKKLDSVAAASKKKFEFHHIRARLLVQLEDRGDEAAAEIDLAMAISKKTSDPDLLFLKGLALSGTRKWRESVLVLDRAKRAGFDESLVDGAAGAAMIFGRDYAGAEERLRSALGKDPKLSVATYNLGVVRAAQGRPTEAAALIRLAWHLGLRDPVALKKEPLFQAVRAEKGLIDDLLAAPLHESACLTW